MPGWGDPMELVAQVAAVQAHRAGLLATKADCENDLLTFVSTFWHVVEPTRPLIKGWPLDFYCDLLMATVDGHHTRVLLNLPPGFMKLIADATPIMTPRGWRQHGDLVVGDEVFGPDGVPTQVVAVSPRAPADHEVDFSTGETIKCNGDHLWRVYDRHAHKWKTVETRWLAAANRPVGRNRFFIQETAALILPEAELPLHPYFVGCWLGDGTASKPRIAHAVEDREHIVKLEGLGFRPSTTYRQGNTDHVEYWGQGIQEQLRSLGLWRNKHIPPRYLMGSVEQRLELLAGLIDTDGTVDRSRERVIYYTTDQRLADGVKELVRSLGMRPYETTMAAPGYGDYASAATYHLVGFQPTLAIPTVIPRKAIGRLDYARRRRAITGVRLSEQPEMGQCIQVARPDGLYVVGRTNVVTHNSLVLNVFLPAWIWGPCGAPSTRFISASYAAYLTERDNGRLLRLLKDQVYRQLWPAVRLTKEGVGKLENDATGWKLATSVSGVGTGERGDWILIDDANNPLEVESEAVRSTTNLWLREVMPDRLNNLTTGIIFGVQQRTHEQDATGTLSHPEEGWPAFTWVAVPMEYDPLRDQPVVLRWDEAGLPIEVWRDPRGLDAAGEVLEGRYEDARGEVAVRGGSPLALADGMLAWPERFSAEKVAEQKRIKGPYAYAGQYQQLAQVRGGGIIRREWWRLWSEERFPDLGTVVASLDTAIKESEESDWNAFQTWGAFAQADGSPGLILTSAWKLRASLAELVLRVAEACWERKVDYLLIEDKARGHDVAAEIVRQYSEAPWQTVLIPVNGRGAFSGDKVSRLHAVAPLFSGDVRKHPVTGIDEWLGGMIYAPDRAWADEVIAEVASFPRGAHDDHVDATSQAIAWVRRHGVVLRKVEHEREELSKRMFKRVPELPYAIRREG